MQLNLRLPRAFADPDQQKAENEFCAGWNAALVENFPRWTQNVFNGPAPTGYADWFAWMSSNDRRGAVIRAAAAEDWGRPEVAGSTLASPATEKMEPWQVLGASSPEEYAEFLRWIAQRRPPPRRA